MNKNYIKLWVIALVALFALNIACSDDVDPMIDIPADFSEVKLTGGKLTQAVKLEANQEWNATVKATRSTDASWLTVSPESGKAGEIHLTITADQSFTTEDRTAYVHIIIDGLSKSIEVTQEAGILVIKNDEVEAPVEANGFYVVNEDWFGHSEGSLNFFEKTEKGYNPQYRVYRAANDGATFGVSTTYGAIWGDNAYFVSKQGARLVVADATTLRYKKEFENLNGIGDGRGFVGVDDKKAYIGGSSGIVVFDIENLTLAEKIEGVSGQIGNMVAIAGRVFAVSNNTLYVIDASTNEVENSYVGSYNTLTLSKDGSVWVAAADKLIKLDPATLEQEEIDYPGGAKINGSWGAWNAGGLTASQQTNTLYWTSGGSMWGGDKKVVKYDIDTKSVNTDLFELGQSSYGSDTEFYGAGLRVDPLTDELVLTVRHSGWGDSYAYNWIYVLDNNGNQKAHFELGGDNGTASDGNEAWGDKYYWFPAMPMFKDVNKPQILLNQVLLATGGEQTVDLSELIVDHDSPAALMIKSVVSEDDMATVSFEGDLLTVKAGETAGLTSCTLSVVSNGVRVDKTIEIAITD